MTELKDISKTRGDNRKELIKNVCEDITRTFNLLNKSFFTRKEILSLFDCEGIKPTALKSITNEIINYLIKCGRIEPTKIKNKIVFYRTALLTSRDHGSFKNLMNKNGYKSKPDKRSFYNSSIPRSKQGVYSRGNKSIIRVEQEYFINGFKKV